MDVERFRDVLLLANRPSTYAIPSFTPGLDWSTVRLLIIGSGGLGCELLHNFALSGFTNLDIIDMDTIDLSNLNRQFLFREADVGQPKSQVAAAFVTKRCPWVTVTPHFGRIEDKSNDFYRQFPLIVLGLDSVHARQWINEKAASLAEWGNNPSTGAFEVLDSIVLIDGGTEGFKGSVRRIQFGQTACIECAMYLFPPTRRVPMCTLESVPRVPEHCVLFVKEKTWEVELPFGPTVAVPDGDNTNHIVWITKKAVERQLQFGIQGLIDVAFTLGVVKNVVPAVGFTNAMIAAQCVLETLKILTGLSTPLNNFSFYDGGGDGICSYSIELSPNPSCPVCSLSCITIRRENCTPREILSALSLHPNNDRWKIHQDSDVFLQAFHRDTGKRVVLLYNNSNVMQSFGENEKLRSCNTLSDVFPSDEGVVLIEATGGSLNNAEVRCKVVYE